MTTPVAAVRIILGRRVIWLPFETFYDAHAIAKALSDGCDSEVQVWEGAVMTYSYHEGTGVQSHLVTVQ